LTATRLIDLRIRENHGLPNTLRLLSQRGGYYGRKPFFVVENVLKTLKGSVFDRHNVTVIAFM
ncbi:hypothetical protein, partial [Escherichia coli]|uniref:hypothetical protein n=1 Tax=Escherichia coli TaxID=562 RepID=UPI001980230A